MMRKEHDRLFRLKCSEKRLLQNDSHGLSLPDYIKMNIDRTNPDLQIFYLIDEGPSVLKRQTIKTVVHLHIYLFSGKYEYMIAITPVDSIRVSQRRNFLSQ